MAKVIEETETRFADPESLEAQVSEYSKLKASMEVLDARSKVLRDKLMGALDLSGDEDDKGNIQLVFPSAINGIVRLEKQRRASRKLNESAAETVLEAVGLGDTVYKMVRTIDEDALMAAFYEGQITEDQLDEMYPVHVIWALRTVKS